MSEGIQNVIFNLMNTSVVCLLQHPERNDPSLPEAQKLTLCKKKKMMLNIIFVSIAYFFT